MKAVPVVRVANDQFRQARLRQMSPSGSGQRLSRRELADLVNAYLARTGASRYIVASYVGSLERGEYRWPLREYREAFRAVLGAQTDAELGFYKSRRQTDLP